MVDVKEFYNELLNNEIDFFIGVFDLLLKFFCGYIKDNVSNDKYIMVVNEGNVIGFVSGYYLSIGKIGFVYM